MATTKPQQQATPTPRPLQPTTPPPRIVTTPVRKAVKPLQPKKEYLFLFDRDNYILMALGVLLIFIGFELMSGGKSPDPHQFLYNEIYSFRRITVAPIVVLLGFAVEVFAIMKKPKDKVTDTYIVPAAE